jgi:hypothetical protein
MCAGEIKQPLAMSIFRVSGGMRREASRDKEGFIYKKP